MGVLLRVLLPKEYPARIPIWLPGFMSDYSPSGSGTCGKSVIQLCNREAYSHYGVLLFPSPPQLYQGRGFISLATSHGMPLSCLWWPSDMNTLDEVLAKIVTNKIAYITRAQKHASDYPAGRD
jgi:hypothetical protein